jgi:hypothetical protein
MGWKSRVFAGKIGWGVDRCLADLNACPIDQVDLKLDGSSRNIALKEHIE